MPSRDSIFLGIDVGGTDVKVGLVDDEGKLVSKHKTATERLETPERVFQYAIDHARSELADLGFYQDQLVSVGLAVPGVLDRDTSCLREVVNLPAWKDVPLRQLLRHVSQLPSAVVNDANAAAFAEHHHRGLGNRSLALVTLGTGIGCGLISSGDPHGGDHGCAGELGHIAIDFSDDALPCTCGSRGHLESYAGAAGVIRRLRDAIEQADPADAQHSLRQALERDTLTPREISDAAERGDQACLQVVEQTARYVGQAIGLLCQVLDPEVVLVGGAMTFGGAEKKTGQHFLDLIHQTVTQTTLVQVGGNVLIGFASLGNDAGMLGAASIAQQHVESTIQA